METRNKLENKENTIVDGVNHSTSLLSPINTLPIELLKNNKKEANIVKYLTPFDKRNLALCNKKFYTLFKPYIKLANKHRHRFLDEVLRGDKNTVKKILLGGIYFELDKHNAPYLLLEQATLIDKVGRQIFGTALGIAYGARDISTGIHEEMVELIERFIKLLPASEIEIAQQKATQFPQGYELIETERKKSDSIALHKIFEAIEKSSSKIDCTNEITAFKEHLKKQTEKIITSGFHFNEHLYVEAYNLYEKHFKEFGHISEKNELMNDVLSIIEAYFPARFKMASRNFNVVKTGGQVNRTIDATEPSFKNIRFPGWIPSPAEYTVVIDTKLNEKIEDRFNQEIEKDCSGKLSTAFSHS